MRTYKQDTKIMDLLHIAEIRRVICNTEKGFLNLVLRKGESEYFLTLDAVPLDKETNKEVLELLFPKQPIPQINKEYDFPKIPLTEEQEDFKRKAIELARNNMKDIKKKDRPKGSKNGKSME